MRWLPFIIPVVLLATAALGIFWDRSEKQRNAEAKRRELDEITRKLAELETAYESAEGAARQEALRNWKNYLGIFTGHKPEDLPSSWIESARRYKRITENTP